MGAVFLNSFVSHSSNSYKRDVSTETPRPSGPMGGLAIEGNKPCPVPSATPRNNRRFFSSGLPFSSMRGSRKASTSFRNSDQLATRTKSCSPSFRHQDVSSSFINGMDKGTITHSFPFLLRLWRLPSCNQLCRVRHCSVPFQQHLAADLTLGRIRVAHNQLAPCHLIGAATMRAIYVVRQLGHPIGSIARTIRPCRLRYSSCSRFATWYQLLQQALQTIARLVRE
jgi:hypothetical protein